MVLYVYPPLRFPILAMSSAETYSWFLMPISIAANILISSLEMKCKY